MFEPFLILFLFVSDSIFFVLFFERVVASEGKGHGRMGGLVALFTCLKLPLQMAERLFVCSI